MNIFIGNISQQLDEVSLQEIFGQFGLVSSVKIVKGSFTGAFRGFGFVEMFSETEGLNAIRSLNNKMVLGKRLKINRRED